MTSTKSMQASFVSTASLEVQSLKQKKEIQALKQTVTKLLQELDRVKEIDRTIPKLIVTPEEELLECQIKNLNAESRMRKLTLEEVKTLDLLIKNKRLIKKQSTSNNDITLPADLSDDELMRIAESVTDKNEGSE